MVTTSLILRLCRQIRSMMKPIAIVSLLGLQAPFVCACQRDRFEPRLSHRYAGLAERQATQFLPSLARWCRLGAHANLEVPYSSSRRRQRDHPLSRNRLPESRPRLAYAQRQTWLWLLAVVLMSDQRRRLMSNSSWKRAKTVAKQAE